MLKAKKNLYIEVIAAKLDDTDKELRLAQCIATSLEKYYSRVRISLLADTGDLQEVIENQPDLIFVTLKLLSNQIGEKINVCDYLERAGVNFTGSGSIAMESERDKTKAKDVLIGAGLNTSPYFLARKDQHSPESGLPLEFPLFIKPYDLGEGSGIDDKSVVRNLTEYEEKIQQLAYMNIANVLVEKYISGREFTVAVLRDSISKNLMVMPIEQLPVKNAQGDAVIGHAMKSAKKETAVGTVEQGDLRQDVIDLARATFDLLGARDYGRVDMRLDENDVPQFLEINLIPNLVEGSGNFTKAFKLNTSETYDELILRIANLALSRASKSMIVKPKIISLSPVILPA